MDVVYLRPLEPGDLERIHAWHNSEELYRSLIGQYRPCSLDTVREWLAQRCKPNERERSFAICRSSDSLHIGNIYLKDIDRSIGGAELHIFIGDPDQRGHGFGTAAVELLAHYAADELHLQRLYLQVLKENLAAIRVYQSCGFSVERVLANYCIKAGELRDVLWMTRSLVADECP
jgi:RimJ/RimL family protein N-acetyltransferase